MTVTESNQAKKGNLLLIGDLMIDQTWPVRATKLSPEAPVPVAQITRPLAIERPGGAGLAASFGTKNFHDMNLYFYTATADERMKWLHDKNIKANGTMIELSQVITKTRFIEETSKYHLLRIDNDDIAGKSGLDLNSFMCDFNDYIELGLDGIVLLDYQKGIFDNEGLLFHLIKVAEEQKIPVYVDSRAGNLTKFTGATYLKLNKKEFKEACINLGCRYPLELISVLELEALLITKGEEGAELWRKNDSQGYSYQASLGPHPGAPDVTGCGDAFDISFCYYRFIEGFCPQEAIGKAVDMATDYAHMPIEERLC